MTTMRGGNKLDTSESIQDICNMKDMKMEVSQLMEVLEYKQVEFKCNLPSETLSLQYLSKLKEQIELMLAEFIANKECMQDMLDLNSKLTDTKTMFEAAFMG